MNLENRLRHIALRMTLAVSAVGAGAVNSAGAAQYCLAPKIDQINGRCPTGYSALSGCCSPREGARQKPACIARKGSCPSNYRTSGDFCCPF